MPRYWFEAGFDAAGSMRDTHPSSVRCAAAMRDTHPSRGSNRDTHPLRLDAGSRFDGRDIWDIHRSTGTNPSRASKSSEAWWSCRALLARSASAWSRRGSIWCPHRWTEASAPPTPDIAPSLHEGRLDYQRPVQAPSVAYKRLAARCPWIQRCPANTSGHPQFAHRPGSTERSRKRAGCSFPASEVTQCPTYQALRRLQPSLSCSS